MVEVEIVLVEIVLVEVEVGVKMVVEVDMVVEVVMAVAEVEMEMEMVVVVVEVVAVTAGGGGEVVVVVDDMAVVTSPWGLLVVTQCGRGGWRINGPQRGGAGARRAAIDMFNKLALMTAGVIVREPVGSAPSYGGLQTPHIAACVLISPFSHNGIRSTPGK